MKRRIALVTVVGALGALSIAGATTASAQSVCVNAHIQVNDTVQDIHQCLPPS